MTNCYSTRISLGISSLILSVIGSAQAQAQENGAKEPAAAETAASPVAAGDRGDIIVTATRRSESLQNVPLSITAVTGESLERKSATSFFDYGSSVPNLSFGNTTEGTTSSRTIAIRGIADRNTTGFYIDDTPVLESLDPRIVDVSRIEVLRGPQGTLYGARSMGGTVRLITIQPDPNAFEVRAHASLSDTSHASSANYQVDGAVNIPIAKDKVGMRIVGIHESDAGFFTREYGPASGPTQDVRNIGRTRIDGISVAMIFKPTDEISFTPRLLWQKTNVDGFPFADVAVGSGNTPDILRPTSFTQRRLFNVGEFSRDNWLLATFDIHYEKPFGTITSSSSFFHRRTRDVEDQTDFIASPAAFNLTNPIPTSIEIDNNTDGFTQELRFASSFSGPIQIVAGAFYNRTKSNRIFPPNIINPFGLIYQTSTPVQQSDYAAYAEASYEIVTGLKAIAGARVFEVDTTSMTTSDGLVVGGPTVIPRRVTKEHGVQPKFSLQYQIAPGNQIFATAAKGFRPGGVNGVVPTAFGCAANLAALGITPNDAAFYQSDSVWSYEAGVKTTFADHRATFNLSGFRIDWKNIQQRIQLQCGFSFRGNAGVARSQGAELEFTVRPVNGLSLLIGAGYTDAKFVRGVPGTRFSAGDRIPQVPKYTLTTAADYTVPIGDGRGFFVHGEYRYVDSSTSASNAGTDAQGRLIPRIRPAYSIVDARLGVSFGRSEVAVFGKNLTNVEASLSDAVAVAAEAPGRARVAVNQPRTIGIEFRSRF